MTISAPENARDGDPLATLRGEMAMLGSLLGRAVRTGAGEVAFDAVERLRELAYHRREERDAEDRRRAEHEMVEMIRSLDQSVLRSVVRAFTVFLDLANLAEDRQRVRVLRRRTAAARPEPIPDSAAAAIDALAAAQMPADEVQSLIDRISVELVFTAHPTDAKRRSVRNKFRHLRELLATRDASVVDPIDDDTTGIDAEIEKEIIKIWQTNFIRPWRPSVMQEVRRGMSIKPVLWRTAPAVLATIRERLHEKFGDAVTLRGNGLSFGSWIGGDRDGHPGVTASITAETLSWLRAAAIEFHVGTCNDLFGSLSFSGHGIQFPESIETTIDSYAGADESLSKLLEGLPPGETCRRWLAVIGRRLHHAGQIQLDGSSDPHPIAYGSPSQLRSDVVLLRDAVAASPLGESLTGDVQAWIDRVDMFGFHLAKLDIRQDARVYRPVLEELRGKITAPESAKAGSGANGGSFDDDAERLDWLCRTIDDPVQIDETGLSDIAADTLALFRLLRRVHVASGGDGAGGGNGAGGDGSAVNGQAAGKSQGAVGSHVISMTASAADVMTVLWFWRQAGRQVGQNDSPSDPGLPISPLLETIEDLGNGPDILRLMFDTPVYREHLRRQGDRQNVMLGYSDSTKDGGYLSACWSLHEAQQNLSAAAERDGVSLTFFHGRGGSLGRGGGPAARGITSLPAGAFDGTMRLTEQGEVLADRYDDPAIASRHLDQVMGAVIRRTGLPPEGDNEDWRDLTRSMTQASFAKYRELIESEGFVDFFRRVTPINEIEQLPIGSRPARRGGGGKLSDLRAIPWVFSWTQSRCMLPAWYGLGTGLAVALEQPDGLQTLRSMYRDWPFFTAMIDNAELALSKSDMKIAGHYAEMAQESAEHERIKSLIADEFDLSLRHLLAVIEQDDLLGGTAWLRESIRVRNRYIDPLNLIQVEVLRRTRAAGDDDPDRRHLARLTINGIAAGMRTSG